MPPPRARRPALGTPGAGLILCWLVGSLALLTACRGASQAYTLLGPRAAPLRAQFNQDAGRTRIVILPAPN